MVFSCRIVTHVCGRLITQCSKTCVSRLRFARPWCARFAVARTFFAFASKLDSCPRGLLVCVHRTDRSVLVRPSLFQNRRRRRIKGWQFPCVVVENHGHLQCPPTNTSAKSIAGTLFLLKPSQVDRAQERGPHVALATGGAAKNTQIIRSTLSS